MSLSHVLTLLARFAFVAVVFPVAVVLGALVAMPFGYRFRAEDPDQPSGLVTVMAVWEVDGQTLCRAFRYEDLVSHRDTLQLRFALTSEDLIRCREDFAAYDRAEGWPRKLEDNERRYEGFRFDAEGTPPSLELTVRRFHGDAISATTRYRVNSEGVISDVGTRSTGPGSGLLPVLGGFAGAVVWLLWALWLAVTAWRRRKSALDGF